MVDSIHTSSLQLESLLRLQQSEATANVEAVLIFDLTHDIGDMINFTIAWAATAGHDAISSSLAFGRFASAVQQSLGIQHRILFNRRFGDLGLRTVIAVFRAETAFGVLQIVELNRFPEVLPADSIGRVQNRQQLVVVGSQDSHGIRARQRFAREDLIGHFIPGQFRSRRINKIRDFRNRHSGTT